MMSLILAAVLIPASVRLFITGVTWWARGDADAFISQPHNHARRMAEWQERVNDCQERLAYLSTPGWFDLEWPICDSLSVSADGEYCTNCYRQVYEHVVGAGVA